MRNALDQVIWPEDYKRWEMGLKHGDLVQARWTRYWVTWQAKGRIVKFNLCSAQVVLEEVATSLHNSANRSSVWTPGSNRTVPLKYYNGPLRFSGGLEVYKEGAEIACTSRGAKWSNNNGLFPLE